MQVRMAEHHGMCFGVRDALALALELTSRGEVAVLGDLVHNPDVVDRLDRAGAVRVRHLDEVTGTDVLLTAHGVSNRVKLQLREAGKKVHDATCPLVTRAHLALAKLAGEGCFPVVVGQRDHVEVRGLVGDFDDFEVVLDASDLERLKQRFADGAGIKLGVVSQTTQPIDLVQKIVADIRRTLPLADVRFIDTVCQPTKERQQSLKDLIASTEAVVVVGGPESNNSRKLAEAVLSAGLPAYRVGRADELRPEWFDGIRVVGLTAGTSTPDDVIDEVRRRLEML